MSPGPVLLCKFMCSSKHDKLVEEVELTHANPTYAHIKACVRYFYQIFIYSPNDSPSKTMKNAFYFIVKALFILEIFKFLYFRPLLFFSLSGYEISSEKFLY